MILYAHEGFEPIHRFVGIRGSFTRNNLDYLSPSFIVYKKFGDRIAFHSV